MSITKILSDKDLDASEKLAQVATLVGAAREAYGNSDSEIESPKVTTTNGEMSFVHLDDESKVAVLKTAVAKLKVKAVEVAEQTPGTNINKEIERLLATHPMFVNISAGTKFEYI